MSYFDFVLCFRGKLRVQWNMFDNIKANDLPVEFAFQILIFEWAIFDIITDFFDHLDRINRVKQRCHDKERLLHVWHTSVNFHSPELFLWESPSFLDCKSRGRVTCVRSLDREEWHRRSAHWTCIPAIQREFRRDDRHDDAEMGNVGKLRLIYTMQDDDQRQTCCFTLFSEIFDVTFR